MWDGEGITRGDHHDYIMLCNSNRRVLESAETLPFESIMGFLGENVGSKDTLHIGFGIGYDVGMWLRTLSDAPCVTLLSGKKVNGRAIIAGIYRNESRAITFLYNQIWYSILYRSRKQFSVRAFSKRPQVRAGDSKRSQSGLIYSFVLWDVWGFYQSSFIQALEKNNIVSDAKMIANMKQKRATFTEEERDEIREYCFQECEAGVLLYKQTLAECYEADILPARHDGPGALAAALFKRECVKEYIQFEDEPVRIPVASAYFGGRIELAGLGRIRDLCGYDIASAYPSIIQLLPSLVGEWIHADIPGTIHLRRVRYEYDTNLPFYPLPYRYPNGSVVFASEGEGWYWDSEFRAARIWEERFQQIPAEVVETWTFRASCPDERPFSFVPELFRQRAEWVRAGIGGEKIIKLALNSCYGKLAQQLGGSIDNLPPYLSLVWAGMITAGTRAELLKAACAAKDPKNVVAFMTDGLYVREELDIETRPKELGYWEPPEKYVDAVFVQAGVYWTKSKEGGEWKARYRGFDKEAMRTPDAVLDAWAQGRVSVEMSVTRFASFGASLMSKDLWEKRCTWVTSTRRLDLIGTCVKREATQDIFRKPFVNLKVKRNLAYLLDRRTSSPYDAITIPIQDNSESLLADDIEEIQL